MFARLGNLVIRRAWWVIAAWVVVTIAIILVAPSLSSVSSSQTNLVSELVRVGAGADAGPTRIPRKRQGHLGVRSQAGGRSRSSALPISRKIQALADEPQCGPHTQCRGRLHQRHDGGSGRHGATGDGGLHWQPIGPRPARCGRPSTRQSVADCWPAAALRPA